MKGRREESKTWYKGEKGGIKDMACKGEKGGIKDMACKGEKGGIKDMV